MSRRRTPAARNLALEPIAAAKSHEVQGRRPEEVREKALADRPVGHGRSIDTLGRMLRAGLIDGTMHDAGQAFHRAFVAAGLDPLRAASMLRVPGAAREPEVGHRQLAARRRVQESIAVLGGHDSPGGSCVWFVLGHRLSLRQWALRQRWAGRAVRPDEATGVLVAALATLAARRGHWVEG